MTSKSTKLNGAAPLASLRNPTYPTERAAKSAKKTARISPLREGYYNALKMKTNQSQWTPILNKPSNEQMYTERRELIDHWFDLWTDVQRKRYLQHLMLRCTRSQILYLSNWFQSNVVVQHVDFASVLPRFLSLYILSFLDPRSLCQVAKVCWHFRFISEQDVLWMPKCVKLGWFLPYKPKDNEYGAWKRHYIQCLKSLDVAQSPKDFGLYGRLGEDYTTERTTKRRGSDVIVSDKLNSRPVWLDPDPRPNDLEQAFRIMTSPDQPGVAPSTLSNGTDGLSSPRRRGRSRTEPSRVYQFGLADRSRRDTHRSQGVDDFEIALTSVHDAGTLSASMTLENGQTLDSAWEQAVQRRERGPVSRRKDLSGGGDYPTNVAVSSGSKGLGMPSGCKVDHPRVLIVSNQITAVQLVVSAVKPDVKVVAYEYIGTTIESLLHKLEEALAGSHARSIGILAEGWDEIGLVGSMSTNTASLEKPELRNFWERLCMHILPGTEGGHVDVFVPLAACDDGRSLLDKLHRLTGAIITSPSTMTDSKYGHVLGEWSNWGQSTSPASLYLDYDKLTGWLASSDRVLEATEACHRSLGSFLRDEREDMTARVAGDVVFEALAIRDGRLDRIAPWLVTALSDLTMQSLEVDPLRFVGKHLLKASSQHASDNKTPRQPTSAKMSPAGQSAKMKPSQDDEIFEDINGGSSDFDSDENIVNHNALHSIVSLLRPAEGPTEGKQLLGSSFRVTHLPTGDLRQNTALQLLTSEFNYMKHLTMIEDGYRRPLLAGLKSNRAIISHANIHMIFTDVSIIRTITNEIMCDLGDRLEHWSAEQCVGDCFIKFQAKMKAYTNFHKNYQIVLATLDKCRQQTPAFRAFLKRTDRSPATRMMTLTELLLYPARRIGVYIQMLLALQGVTPNDHPDDGDLGRAVAMFRQLQALVDECQERTTRERQLHQLQLRIKKAPTLLEANRYLIREQVVASLQQVQDDGLSTSVYEHVDDLGLFLFNDALMITIRSIKTVAYSRQTEEIHHFHSSVALAKLRIDELPDSQYLRNAFELAMPKRRWICAVDDESDGMAFVSALRAAIQASLEES